jgi:predicted PurR-regulated permease PerM
MSREAPLLSHLLLNKQTRVSYLFIIGTVLLIAWFHLATPLLAALFSYFALTKLHFRRKRGKWLTIILFVVVLAGLAYGLGHFTNKVVRELPEIASKAVPLVIQWAKEYKIELPFSDYDSLRELAFESVSNVSGQMHYLTSFAKFARGATTQFVFLIVGTVVAISLFLNPRIELGGEANPIPNNLYSLCCEEIGHRFSTLYSSFDRVMGAQILISLINTVMTMIFIMATQLPYALVVIGATFLCGLLPVIGNLISNTIIVGIAFTISPRMALAALTFLVVIHKLEYFLNSKIIGLRIRNPLWLTLLGLVIGERLMGIPGMILAPVFLNYIKVEASRIPVAQVATPATATTGTSPTHV